MSKTKDPRKKALQTVKDQILEINMRVRMALYDALALDKDVAWTCLTEKDIASLEMHLNQLTDFIESLEFVISRVDNRSVARLTSTEPVQGSSNGTIQTSWVARKEKKVTC